MLKLKTHSAVHDLFLNYSMESLPQRLACCYNLYTYRLYRALPDHNNLLDSLYPLCSNSYILKGHLDNHGQLWIYGFLQKYILAVHTNYNTMKRSTYSQFRHVSPVHVTSVQTPCLCDFRIDTVFMSCQLYITSISQGVGEVADAVHVFPPVHSECQLLCWRSF